MIIILLNLIILDEILFILFFPGIDMIRVTFERIKNSKKYIIQIRLTFIII